MLNPFAEIVSHYVNKYRLRSPVIAHRGAGTLTLGIRSPQSPARKDVSTARRDLASVRTLTLFASDAEIAVAHRAPKATFSDEIRLRKARGALPDAQRLKIPRWPDAMHAMRVGPLVILVDTAERQTKSCVAAAAEDAARADLRRKKCEMFAPGHGNTLAARRIVDGSHMQREFDLNGTAPREGMWLAHSAPKAA